MNRLPAAASAGPVDISFVVIGYNEEKMLSKCLSSIQQADLAGISYEIIYVDGGSRDRSMNIAEAASVDRILGGERRRKAAENRNLGFRNARGRFVQFLDGDMAMDPQWPQAAFQWLSRNPAMAAVCGRLKEVNPSLCYRALEIDWKLKEGEVLYCGGAALWRKEVLNALGGFPENIAFGEEPYLCWRVRNELHLGIYQLSPVMAAHDLGFRGWRDYIARSVRCGETYAEVAARCCRAKDKLWLKEAFTHLFWGGCFAALSVWLAFSPKYALACLIMVPGLLITRKFLQVKKKGVPEAVALVYALHIYFSKLPIAWGECKWLMKRFFRN